MKNNLTLQQRVDLLEQGIYQIKSHLFKNGQQPWWQKIVGVVENDSDSDAWLNVKLWVEENERYLISRMGVQPGAAPAESSGNIQKMPDTGLVTNKVKSESERKIADEEVTKFLNELINELVAKDEFSEAILVARDGKPIFASAVGYAHKGFKVSNQ